MKGRLFLGIVAVSMLGGCASGGQTPGQSRASDNRIITLEQLTAARVATAYDAVERLRPLWLRESGARSLGTVTEIVVVAFGQYFGDVTSLRSIPTETVREMQYMSGPEATNAYPSLANGRHLESAIVVYPVTLAQ
ncbi:MAG: hypothetical protein EXR92_04205 [Gemmatimonadetes bacterium]|nr:hypothetical protein [Gemmatimonadota bacterium]